VRGEGHGIRGHQLPIEVKLELVVAENVASDGLGRARAHGHDGGGGSGAAQLGREVRRGSHGAGSVRHLPGVVRAPALRRARRGNHAAVAEAARHSQARGAQPCRQVSHVGTGVHWAHAAAEGTTACRHDAGGIQGVQPERATARLYERAGQRTRHVPVCAATPALFPLLLSRQPQKRVIPGVEPQERLSQSSDRDCLSLSLKKWKHAFSELCSQAEQEPLLNAQFCTAGFSRVV